MEKHLRIILCQQNFFVGDISGNTQKIISAITAARDDLKADLVAFPELALTGYPPEDLLLREDFKQSVNTAFEHIVEHTKGITAIVGYPQSTPAGIYNAAAIIQDGKVLHTYAKQCLPNYAVFDEKRYFIPGHGACVFTLKGLRMGLVICEDAWFSDPAKQAVKNGAQIIISINASPFDLGKFRLREKTLRDRITETNVPFIYVHQVGAQDEFIFDGGSFAMDEHKTIRAHANFFEEQLYPIDIDTDPLRIHSQPLPLPMTTEARAYNALVLGTQEYINKNKFSGAIVGVSGGIDSALTLAIAVDALGADRVHAVYMPSRYSSALSATLAESLAKLLKVEFSVIPIEPAFKVLEENIQKVKAVVIDHATDENIQARCRAIILMALSNKTGKIVLNTSNKSEIAVGYGTLYGDMAGGFAILKDVFKTFVYKLADYRNSISMAIPVEIIHRVPTAELAPDQTDEAALLPYPILDSLLEKYVEQNLGVAEIVATGIDEASVRRIIQLIIRSEYKRRQAPPGIKITPKAFGRDWRFPITSGFKP